MRNRSSMLARRSTQIAGSALVALLLAACASAGRPQFPEPLRAPKAEPVATPGTNDDADAQSLAVRQRIVPGPTTASAPIVTVDRESLPKMRSRKPITLTLDSVNLTGFINEVFGNQLGFSLDIDQAVQQREELVSLRLVEPEPAERVYVIAREVLKRYGVAIEESKGVLRFVVQSEADAEPPQLFSGRDLPDVPASQRPIFVVVPLDVSEPGRIAAHVRNLFSAQPSLKVAEMIESNALLVSGPPVVVQAALETITLLDRIGLREKFSLRINPLYLGADALTKELKDVLVAQGYSVRTGAGSSGVLTLVPVPSANALILFSESREALDAAAQWAESLDQPSDDAAGDGGVYMYSARFTTVESLRPVLEALIGASPAASAGSAQSTARPEVGGGASPPPSDSRPGATATSVSVGNNQLVVDPARNTIIFQGEAQRWRALQGVLARLDQPARQVVIEVTVAEVTLTDELSHGIEWALREANLGDFGGPLTALTGAGSRNLAGVTWRPLSSSGQVKAVLNAFASNSKVSILSTPRLMVRSGETASIDVGTEVPTITSQATAPDLQQGGSSSLLQQVQYRKTGVLLEIEAVVHSGHRVDLRVSQEVSEAQTTDTSEIASPSIFSRKLQTSLSLSDGDSYLLGGLISSSDTRGGSEVPGLGRIPLLGKLFQNNLNEKRRTELLLLITPYVVEDAAQAREITDAIRQRFESATR